ncbi:MAG TPA: hypothetical protein VLN74_05610 [Ilumatobacteraceae bacterium]|nr:hypothetical protein [Ilumatobacteraceae bacterium]
MNRRSGPWFARILFALALVVGLLVPQVAQATAPPVEPTVPATIPAASSTASPTDDIVVDEANPFLPENRNLTECIGMLQRPGCGSEARGGWHQNAVAIVMIAGLLLVFGRIAWGVRRSQKQMAANAPD